MHFSNRNTSNCVSLNKEQCSVFWEESSLTLKVAPNVVRRDRNQGQAAQLNLPSDRGVTPYRTQPVICHFPEAPNGEDTESV